MKIKQAGNDFWILLIEVIKAKATIVNRDDLLIFSNKIDDIEVKKEIN